MTVYPGQPGQRHDADRTKMFQYPPHIPWVYCRVTEIGNLTVKGWWAWGLCPTKGSWVTVAGLMCSFMSFL